MAYRKPGTLLPLESEILSAVARRGADGAHGFVIAQDMAGGVESSRSLVSHGTLYKALARLQARGLLRAQWERATEAEAAGRPRRKLYWITGEGAAVLAAATAPPRGPRLGPAPA